jgi:hypothetical protein
LQPIGLRRGKVKRAKAKPETLKKAASYLKPKEGK